MHSRILIFIVLAWMSGLTLGNTVAPAPQSMREDLLLLDASRGRTVPVSVYTPPACKPTAKECHLALVSGGYGGSHLDYSFLAQALNARGYVVASIQHDQPDDPPVAPEGDLRKLRMPTWARGADNLSFVRDALAKRYPDLNSARVLLLGHSQGGDISSLWAARNPSHVLGLVTLDHRRMPLPRQSGLAVLSIRASDFEADVGVLPSADEQLRFPISIVKIANARHNDLQDAGTLELKNQILQRVDDFLDTFVRADGKRLASLVAPSESNRQPRSSPDTVQLVAPGQCFLLVELYEKAAMTSGSTPPIERRRQPSSACQTAVSPASTFKVPHALLALHSKVVASPDEVIPFDGRGFRGTPWPQSSRRDHTMETALRQSAVWYFQVVAARLGMQREQDFLDLLGYGNRDPTSGLDTFWLGGSLRITPEQQLQFLTRLFRGELPVSQSTQTAVVQMMRQPSGAVVSASGEQVFSGPRPPPTAVHAKTGSTTDASGVAVRWLVGQIERDGRKFVFVSCVVGQIGAGSLSANAAIDLAAQSLREELLL